MAKLKEVTRSIIDRRNAVLDNVLPIRDIDPADILAEVAETGGTGFIEAVRPVGELPLAEGLFGPPEPLQGPPEQLGRFDFGTPEEGSRFVSPEEEFELLPTGIIGERPIDPEETITPIAQEELIPFSEVGPIVDTKPKQAEIEDYSFKRTGFDIESMLDREELMQAGGMGLAGGFKEAQLTPMEDPWKNVPPESKIAFLVKSPAWERLPAQEQAQLLRKAQIGEPDFWTEFIRSFGRALPQFTGQTFDVLSWLSAPDIDPYGFEEQKRPQNAFNRFAYNVREGVKKLTPKFFGDERFKTGDPLIDNYFRSVELEKAEIQRGIEQGFNFIADGARDLNNKGILKRSEAYELTSFWENPLLKTVSLAAENAPLFISSLLASTVTGSPIPMALAFGAVGAGGTYREAREEGLAPEYAKSLALLNGSFSAGTTLISGNFLLKGVLGRGVGKMLTGAFFEGAQEVAEGFFSNLVAKHGWDKAVGYFDGWNEALWPTLVLSLAGMKVARKMANKGDLDIPIIPPEGATEQEIAIIEAVNAQIYPSDARLSAITEEVLAEQGVPSLREPINADVTARMQTAENQALIELFQTTPDGVMLPGEGVDRLMTEMDLLAEDRNLTEEEINQKNRMIRIMEMHLRVQDPDLPEEMKIRAIRSIEKLTRRADKSDVRFNRNELDMMGARARRRHSALKTGQIPSLLETKLSEAEKAAVEEEARIRREAQLKTQQLQEELTEITTRAIEEKPEVVFETEKPKKRKGIRRERVETDYKITEVKEGEKTRYQVAEDEGTFDTPEEAVINTVKQIEQTEEGKTEVNDIIDKTAPNFTDPAMPTKTMKADRNESGGIGGPINRTRTEQEFAKIISPMASGIAKAMAKIKPGNIVNAVGKKFKDTVFPEAIKGNRVARLLRRLAIEFSYFGAADREINRQNSVFMGKMIVEKAKLDKQVAKIQKIFKERSDEERYEAWKLLVREGDGRILSPEIKQEIEAAREEIDRLSLIIRDEVLKYAKKEEVEIEGNILLVEIFTDLQNKLTANLGKYAARLYQIDYVSNYATNLERSSPERFNNAVDFLIEEEGMDADEARSTVRHILEERMANRFSKKERLAKAIPQARFLKRQDIPKPLRDLFGEITDPTVVIQKTVFDMVNIINKFKMFKALAEFEKDGRRIAYDAPNDAVGAVRQVPENARVYGPLAGKYITQENMEALDDSSGYFSAGTWGQVNQIYQRAQTAYSPGTHGRNTIGNTVFAELSGCSVFNPLNWQYYRKSIAALINKTSTDFKELAESGALGSQLFVSPKVERALKDMNKAIGSTGSILDGLNKARTSIADAAVNLYIAEDLFFRGASYFKQRAKGMTTEEAAEHTDRFYPNYDSNPRMLKRFQRTLVLDPFLSFQAQMPRIFANGAIHNPIKLAMVLAAWKAAKAGWLVPDWWEDEEKRQWWEDAGELVVDWAKDGLVPFSSKGNFKVVNTSNVFPFAGLLEHDPKRYFLGGPVIDTLLVGTIGITSEGFRKIPQKPTPGERIKGMLDVILKAFMSPVTPIPSLADPQHRFLGTEARRISDAIAKRERRFGAAQELSDALLGLVTGIRPERLEFDALWYVKSFEATNTLTERLRFIERVKKDPGAEAVGITAALKELEKAEKLFNDQMEKLDKGLKSARKLNAPMGMPKKEMKQRDAMIKSMRTRIKNIRKALDKKNKNLSK